MKTSLWSERSDLGCQRLLLMAEEMRFLIVRRHDVWVSISEVIAGKTADLHWIGR